MPWNFSMTYKNTTLRTRPTQTLFRLYRTKFALQSNTRLPLLPLNWTDRPTKRINSSKRCSKTQAGCSRSKCWTIWGSTLLAWTLEDGSCWNSSHTQPPTGPYSLLSILSGLDWKGTGFTKARCIVKPDYSNSNSTNGRTSIRKWWWTVNLSKKGWTERRFTAKDSSMMPTTTLQSPNYTTI